MKKCRREKRDKNADEIDIDEHQMKVKINE